MAVSRYYRADSVKTYLNSAVTTSDTQISINSAANFPTSYPFTIIVNRDLSNEEVMQVDSLVSSAGDVTTYAVTRGSSVEPTITAKEHNSGSGVEHGVSARDFRESREHEDAISGVHGVSGSVVGTSDSQTLTNKTFGSGTVVPQSAVTNLVSDLAAKAASIHTHAISDVTSLQTSLDGKAATSHSHVISDTTGLQTALDAKAALASPTLTGTPLAPTASAGTNTTQIATTAFVKTAVDAAKVKPVAFMYLASDDTSPGTISFTELVDTAGGHSDASNPDRYTATVAGYYLINAEVLYDSDSTAPFTVSIRKNGTAITGTSKVVSVAANSIAEVSTSTVVLLNGTTDYIEVNCGGVPGVVKAGSSVSITYVSPS